MNRFTGQCHCGNLQIVFESARAAAELPVRACGCTFCRAHGGLTTTDPAGRLRLGARDPALLNRYRFGWQITDFWICRQCGVYVGATMDRLGIVNVRALADAAAFTQPPAPMDYDGEAIAERRARRALSWTPLAAD